MENNNGKTIEVKVSYNASQECQKQLIKDGRSGVQEQSYLITMPIEALSKLPIVIDRNGKPELTLKEIHYNVSLSWEKPIQSTESFFGGECHCCKQSMHGTYLSQPVYTYEDVLEVFNGNQVRKEKVEAILAQQIQMKELEQKIRQEVTQEVTQKLERNYANALDKVSKIKIVITGKTRVRTSQIQDILN
ncbi:MAG: hypothetical protein WC389_11785 [Lutibacter sp.]|jgi:hypothetical protein